jgi:hypothetical protein
MLAVARLINNRSTIRAVREFRERQNDEIAMQGCEYSTALGDPLHLVFEFAAL